MLRIIMLVAATILITTLTTQDVLANEIACGKVHTIKSKEISIIFPGVIDDNAEIKRLVQILGHSTTTLQFNEKVTLVLLLLSDLGSKDFESLKQAATVAIGRAELCVQRDDNDRLEPFVRDQKSWMNPF